MDDEISQQVKSLRWEDKFFANQEGMITGMITIFDFDYRKIASLNESVNVGCFKRSLIYKGCSNQLMSTSTEQEKKAGSSCQNPREIWLDRST